MQITYLDFDLLIERTGDRYRARILGSPAGEASVEFKVPFSQSEIDNFFIQIGQSRSFETEQTRRIHGFGQALFEAVFQGVLRDRLRASMEEGIRQCDGLRIRLRLADTPELGNLPWEFLYDPGLNRFLALSVESPLVRYLETPKTAQPFAVQPPLRILAMICGPKDFPRLDTEREWDHLQESLAGLQARGLVDLHRMVPPTLPALQQQLRREQYHIFHFIGHGTFSTRDQDGYLLFEDAQHAGKRISGRDLGTILHDHRPLRLAVLNACEGARAAMDDQFAGTAQSLMQQGIPAVIAMQFRITDQASITLAREFYGSLADGYPVDAALTEARKAIKTEGNDLEWGTPVLYMRSPDGRIFDLAQMPGTARPVTAGEPFDSEQAARLGRLYTTALEAFYLGQWESASAKFQDIVDLSPEYRDAETKLAIARQKMQVQALDEQAAAAEKAGKWEEASQALSQLAVVEPAFPELAARQAKARRQAQLAELYLEAGQLAEAGKWEAVLGIFSEMRKLDPRYPDPKGLRAFAEQSLTKAHREADLDAAYTAALHALDGEDWRSAARHLRRVRQIQAGYREVDALWRRVEVELEKARIAKPRPALAPGPTLNTKVERLLLALFALSAVGKGLANLTASALVQAIAPNSAPAIGALIFMIFEGLAAGLVFWWFLSRTVGKLSGRKFAAVLAISVLGQILIVELGVNYPPPSGDYWALLWGAFGLIIGIPIALICLGKQQVFTRRGLGLIAGWGIAYALGQLAANPLETILWSRFGSHIGFTILVAVEQGVPLFLGGWVTLSQLRAGQERPLNMKTILAGAVALGIGQNLVVASTGDPRIVPQLALWGLLAGVALAFPSRSVKRYLLLGFLGGAGLSLGYLVANLVPDPGTQFVVAGAILGLALGSATKNIVKALTLFLVGFIVFGFIVSIYTIASAALSSQSVKFVLTLAAGLGGAILAAAWSYFGRSEPVAVSDPAPS